MSSPKSAVAVVPEEPEAPESPTKKRRVESSSPTKVEKKTAGHGDDYKISACVEDDLAWGMNRVLIFIMDMMNDNSDAWYLVPEPTFRQSMLKLARLFGEPSGTNVYKLFQDTPIDLAAADDPADEDEAQECARDAEYSRKYRAAALGRVVNEEWGQFIVADNEKAKGIGYYGTLAVLSKAYTDDDE